MPLTIEQQKKQIERLENITESTGPVYDKFFSQAYKEMADEIDRINTEEKKTMFDVIMRRGKELQDIAGIKFNKPEENKPKLHSISRKRNMCEVEGHCFNTAREAVLYLVKEGKIELPKYPSWSGYVVLKANKIPYKRI